MTDEIFIRQHKTMEGGIQPKGRYWASNLDIYISIPGCSRADQAGALPRKQRSVC